MRKGLVLATGLALLASTNAVIYQRERLLAHGQVVILELAPVDPRSLMQGDYMALDFALAPAARALIGAEEQAHDGRLVVAADTDGVARLVRRDRGEPLAAREFALRYRLRHDELKFATNAFFFQEGHAERYAAARYGEFRVAASGEMLLTHLLDEHRERLGGAPR